MKWDASRPVPWTRLMREWVVYAGIMVVIFLLFFRDGGMVGAIAGLLVSGPLYVLLGAVLAKLGYQRATIRQVRAAREEQAAAPTPGDARPRPAPTRRTSTGPSNRPRSSAKRRR